MARRRFGIQERKLDEFEREFHELLLACLKECLHGRWGLFGAYDRVKQRDPGLARGLSWPEADRLRELAIQIRDLKSEFGANNWTCEEFLRMCSLNGANDPGEPKLASSFLKQIEERQTTPRSELR